MISAKDIAKRFKNTSPVDRIVRETLRNVVREINHQTREGKTIIHYTLSKMFDPMGDLDSRDVRALVYAGVIQELEINGYKVELKIIDNKPILIINPGVSIAQSLDANTAREFVKRHTSSKQPKKVVISSPRHNTRQEIPKPQVDWSTPSRDIFDILNDCD